MAKLAISKGIHVVTCIADTISIWSERGIVLAGQTTIATTIRTSSTRIMATQGNTISVVI